MQISPPMEKIEAFCRKWRIVEFSLFGSVLRQDFNPDSDVDILVESAPDHGWSLFDVVDMIDELKIIFQRNVDILMKGRLTNPIRRREILRTRRILYAA